MPERRDFLISGASLAATLLLHGRTAAAPTPKTGEHAQIFSGVVRKRVQLRFLIWTPHHAVRPTRGWLVSPLSRAADVQMPSSPAVMVRVSPSVEAFASRC